MLLDVIVPPAAYLPLRNGTINFSSNNPPRLTPQQVPNPANPSSGRQNNQGFEGLTISKDGKRLYMLTQSALIQDTGTPAFEHRRNSRLLEYSLPKKEFTGEWIVQLPVLQNNGKPEVMAQSTIEFLDENRFLILARDGGKGFGQPVSQSIYRQVSLRSTLFHLPPVIPLHWMSGVDAG